MRTQANLTNLDYKHIMEVVKDIADKHHFTVADMRGVRRGPKYTEARREISEVLRDKYNCSYPVIGKFLNKDHTSILYYLHGKPTKNDEQPPQ